MITILVAIVAFTPISPPVLAQTSTVDFTVEKELIADGFELPVYITDAQDDSGRLFVVEKPGRIRIIKDGDVIEKPYLDITELVKSSGNEQGLLSFAFHPKYAENGYLYVDYTDLNGDHAVARYQVSADDPDVADPETAKLLLSVPDQYPNHNGGLLKFGPDGYLYIGMGDGGGGGDPLGSGQRTTSLLGKILRIDVDNGDPYAIPSDNPFVDGKNGAPEVWAYGLRNPWRFSFDRDNGDLYIGDVGQNQYEEIDYYPAGTPGGLNFGWNVMEASHCFASASSNCAKDNLTLPVAEYSHAKGNSVTGGYVYRGTKYPKAEGYYLYGDFGSARVWAMIKNADGTFESTEVGMLDIGLSSFGEDETGELYVTDYYNGGVYRLVLE
ncbi:MAG: PQQ-dependent sugar dehydrogenase [Anaerolineae bacterium]